MIIVLEGIDGVGKSTLAAALSQRTGIPVYTCPRTPMEGQSVAESQAEDRAAIGMALTLGADVIMDRSFPSEWVYGRVHEREFDDVLTLELDQSVARAGGIGVLLGFSDLADAWSRMDGHIGDPELLRDLHEHYEEYVHRSSMGWVRLDAGASVEENLGQLLSHLESGVHEWRFVP